MSAAPLVPCSTCQATSGASHPFCPECGRLSPSFVSRGSFALEIEEVPAEKLRGEIVSLLQSWFPAVDVLEATDRLKSGRTVLMRGIDVESANRILDILKAMKVPGRLVRDDAGRGWFKRFWNLGLIIAAIALLNALVIGGITGIVVAVAGLAALLAWAFVKGTPRSPLISVVPREPEEDLIGLSSEYSAVMNRLSEQDRNILMDLTSSAFDVQQRLQSDSLASVAAGAQTGRLFAGLSDAIRTAVDIARKVPSANEEEKSALRGELRDLRSLVDKTDDWFHSVEEQGIRQPEELSEDLQEITTSIDRILGDVRSPLAEHGRRRDRTLE